MSVESIIRAMPKIDLDVQLEGALPRDLILMIAEQTDIASTYKKPRLYKEWVDLIQKPDFNRLDDIAREIPSWIRHPEDLAHIVYELGLNMSKQNIHYTEISVIPAIYTEFGFTFQEFMDALNDGANRVARAWKVQIKWILSIPRERPRKSDDIARWVTSSTAIKGNVVGMGLVGREDIQPVAQFKKAFATVEKKDIARIAPVYSYPNSDSFDGFIDSVNPTRITDAWGLIDDENAIRYVVENHIPVVVTPSREIRLGRIASLASYPLKELLNKGVQLVINSGMPALYNTTLTDEYLLAVQDGGLSLDDIHTIALNTLHATILPASERQVLIAEFNQAYDALIAEHA